jgi:RNA polymerase sigma factor (sigma-70 family)
MAVPDPTPAFVRFRASGDPEELAAVFDATAAELLRVASHLVSDPHAAEDVVQCTFLSAIESRDRFSPDQPVLPWLLGILTNHARRHRSRVSRHPNPSRIVKSAPAGPDEAAEEIELTLAVSDAIQSLPEPYRPVLVLHLRHGFAPQDIALALGRPPGSVRSQLARGLDQLRRALPTGFAVTMSSLVISTQGLPAMRGLVLEAARVAAPAAATTITLVPVASGGVLLMKKSVLIVALILSAALLGRLTWPQTLSGEVAVAESSSIDGIDVSPSNTLTTRHDEAPNAGPTLEHSRRQLIPSERDVARRSVAVRGRCLAEESRRPLAGCRVHLRGALSSSVDRSEYEREHGAIRWADPQAVVTGSDGRFEFVFDAPPDFRFEVLMRAEGRVRYDESILSLEAGEVSDYGDVALSLGCQLTGSVVDTSGAAQAGVRVSLRRQGPVGRPRPSSNLSATTDRAGRFEFDEPLVASHWSVEFRDRELVAPHMIRISETDVGGREDLLIRVRDESRIPSIRGRVVSTSGQPLRGVDVRYFPGRSGHRDQTSREDGSFVLKQSRDDDAPVVGLKFALRGYEPKTLKGVEWGSEGLRVAMEPGLGIDLRVVDGLTKLPVADFGVFLYQKHQNLTGDYVAVSSAMGDLVHRGRHEGGRIQLSGLRRGTWTVVVVPGHSNFAMALEQTVELSGVGRSQTVVELFPAVEREVFVHTSDGRPVAGTRIELAASIHGGPVAANQMLLDRLRPRHTGAMQAAWRIDGTMSDDAGKAIVRGTRDGVYTVRVLGPGHRPVQVQSVRLGPAADRLDVEVMVGATVRGHVRPLDVLHQYRPSADVLSAKQRSGEVISDLLPAVTLQRLDADNRVQEYPRRRGVERNGVVISDDGRFEIAGVLPGSWWLRLRYAQVQGNSQMSATEELREVLNLGEGEVRKIEVDMANLRRSMLKGTVTVNGAPARNSTVQLLRIGSQTPGKTRASASIGRGSGEDGRFLELLSPGRYWLLLQYADARMERRSSMCSAESVLVVAGRDLEHTFSLRAGRSRLRLVDQAGAAISGVRLMLREVGEKPSEILRSSFSCALTDGAGLARTELHTAGRYEVRIWSRRLNTKARQAIMARGAHARRAAQVLLGTIVIEPGAKAAPWQDLVVPKSAGY